MYIRINIIILFVNIFLFANSLTLNNLKSLDIKGNNLNQYNQRLINNNKIKLHGAIDRKDYVLGPGDELHINFISNNE